MMMMMVIYNRMRVDHMELLSLNNKTVSARKWGTQRGKV